MAKKYKNKYTGDIGVLAEMGYYYELESNSQCVIPGNIVTGGNDWEEIIEPLYKILKYRKKEGDVISWSDTPKEKGYEIWKVLRLEDGEEFTIGDRIIHSSSIKPEDAFTIGNFQIGLPAYIDIWANQKGEHGNLNIRYWKHVTEEPKQLYEVVAYIHNPLTESLKKNIIIWKGEGHFDKAKTDTDYSIWAVQRSSDGVQFSIGDKVIWNWISDVKEPVIIKRFWVDGDTIRFSKSEVGSGWDMNYLETCNNLRHYIEAVPVEEEIEREIVIRIKSTEEKYLKLHRIAVDAIHEATAESATIPEALKVLLTTEDGAKYYNEGSTVWGIDSEYGPLKMLVAAAKMMTECKWFSTEAARDEYVVNNKPVLCLREIMNTGHISATTMLLLEYKIKKNLGMK